MRKPQQIQGKYYVELLSYGEKYGPGVADQAVKKHFAGNRIKILEIGVLRGHHAQVMEEYFQPDLMVLVDPWDFCAETHENNWADTWFRIQNKKNVVVIKATSEKAFGLLDPSLMFDYIYIDGDHTGGDLSPGSENGGIRKDIALWKTRVNQNGILAGHDYNYANIKAEVDKVFGAKVNSAPPDPRGGLDWWVVI